MPRRMQSAALPAADLKIISQRMRGRQFIDAQVCESCKDVLQNPMSTAKQKRTQCMSLTDAGCGVAQRWIVFSEAKRRLQFYSEAEFCEAENIAMGRETLPMARR